MSFTISKGFIKLSKKNNPQIGGSVLARRKMHLPYFSKSSPGNLDLAQKFDSKC